ncbi:MAG: hypothetical protein K2Y28_13655 [Burkholderiaceae bacterium]|nr:hypothetical protein [Burkholderiaceae bacterium]
MSQKFRIHGEFLFQREGQVLITTVRGPWNLEFSKEWQEQITPEAIALAASGNWAAMTIITESILCTPEALEHMRAEALLGVQKMRFVALAFVVGNEVTGHGLLDRSYENLYKDVCPFRIFETTEDAKIWLANYVDMGGR